MNKQRVKEIHEGVDQMSPKEQEQVRAYVRMVLAVRPRQAQPVLRLVAGSARA